MEHLIGFRFVTHRCKKNEYFFFSNVSENYSAGNSRYYLSRPETAESLVKIIIFQSLFIFEIIYSRFSFVFVRYRCITIDSAASKNIATQLTKYLIFCFVFLEKSYFCRVDIRSDCETHQNEYVKEILMC